MTAISSSPAIVPQVEIRPARIHDTAPLRHIAVWDQNNRHLAPSLIEKIARCVFWPLYKLAMMIALPATSSFFKKRAAEACDDFTLDINDIDFHTRPYTPKPVEIKTPDGATLKGTFIEHHECDHDAPLVILMQPNAAIYALNPYMEILDYAHMSGKKCNFLLFDYRGCGLSEGSPLKAKDLIIDGDSVYQFARDSLQVQPNNIHMMGHSFGGGVTAQVKAIRQECGGNYVNDRSFSDITKAAYELAGGGIIGTIAQVFMKILGWGALDTQTALKKISSPTMITYHPLDRIIKEPAQIKPIPLQGNIEFTHLWHPVQPHNLTSNLHCLPRNKFLLEDGRNAIDAIGTSLFRGVEESDSWELKWNEFIFRLENPTWSRRSAQSLKRAIIEFILSRNFLDPEANEATALRALEGDREIQLSLDQKAEIIKSFYSRLTLVYY